MKQKKSSKFTTRTFNNEKQTFNKQKKLKRPTKVISVNELNVLGCSGRHLINEDDSAFLLNSA